MIQKTPGIRVEFDDVKSVFRESIDENDWQGWSLDLHLGKKAYLSSADCPVVLRGDNDWLTIKPGDFALLMTDEYLTMPKGVMAFISLRNTYKQKGLINVSGFHVDPMFEGHLVFSVFNAGPRSIAVQAGETLFMIFFERLVRDVSKPRKRPPLTGITPPMVNAICGKSVTLADNASRLEKLENQFMIMFYAVLAILGLIAAACLPTIIASWKSSPSG